MSDILEQVRRVTYWYNRAKAAEQELQTKDKEIERLRGALRYIAQPTMGFPGGTDAEQWVRDGNGTPENIRLALATCIFTAKKGLT